MRLRTEIRVEKKTTLVKPQTQILTLGSCFSDEIGARLAADGFDCLINPTGALFNAASVCRFLQWALSEEEFDTSLILHRQDEDEAFYSWLHHSKISAATSEELVEKIQASAKSVRDQLLGEEVLLCITLGSAVAFRHKDHGIVANCHKRAMSEFEMVELSVDQITSMLMQTLQMLPKNVKVLFTVSPIRHEYGYGLHHNTLSKARLQLAVDNVCRAYASQKKSQNETKVVTNEETREVFYFPAYEALVDDLRDYRFYGEDLVHPAPLAVEYIYELFKDAFMDAQTKKFASDYNSYHRMLQHRPNNFQAHQRALKIALDKLLAKYPFLDQRLKNVTEQG